MTARSHHGGRSSAASPATLPRINEGDSKKKEEKKSSGSGTLATNNKKKNKSKRRPSLIDSPPPTEEIAFRTPPPTPPPLSPQRPVFFIKQQQSPRKAYQRYDDRRNVSSNKQKKNEKKKSKNPVSASSAIPISRRSDRLHSLKNNMTTNALTTRPDDPSNKKDDASRSSLQSHDDDDPKVVSQLDPCPSEAQLALLCLDYLRDLRRSYVDPAELQSEQSINADYLSVAIYALSRALPDYNSNEKSSSSNEDAAPFSPDNDCRFSRDQANKLTPNLFPREDPKSSGDWIAIPKLSTINEEILYPKNPNGQDEPYHPDLWYTYDDAHPSNTDRMYDLDGLDSMNPPKTLPQLVAAGMSSLHIKSRYHAEQDMIQSPLFEQFLAAVKKKGFFRDAAVGDASVLVSPEELYEERYAKVVSKFRTKLAAKALQEQQDQGMDASQLLAFEAANQIEVRRRMHLAPVPGTLLPSYQAAQSPLDGLVTPVMSPAMSTGHEDDFTVGMSVVTSVTRKLAGDTTAPLSPRSPTSHPDDEQEAERLKNKGNAHMSQKEYALAVDAYTAALKLSPSGPQSHVYFSNRAAAHLSLRQFRMAILDSERSLALQPTYAKAHARLGLAHFLLGDYRQAVEAYTVSLKYDPENTTSRAYLEKAAKRVAAQEVAGKQPAPQPGFSVASEYDKKRSEAAAAAVAPVDPEERRKMVHEREAEKHKLKGNSSMASRNYPSALEEYSAAIKLSSNGPNSHVYFSNRAASLCYLERYEEAEADSLRSLALEPSYGKAHARLGLSRFFMGDYEGAVEAYTAALSYDPDNAASKSYLAKAKSRLEQQQREEQEVQSGLGEEGNESQDATRMHLEDPDVHQRAKQKAMAE